VGSERSGAHPGKEVQARCAPRRLKLKVEDAEPKERFATAEDQVGRNG